MQAQSATPSNKCCRAASNLPPHGFSATRLWPCLTTWHKAIHPKWCCAFSAFTGHVLSSAQQQTLQTLGYETDTNAAKHLTFMNQMVKHSALGADEPTLNRVLFYTGKAYQATPAPAGFFESAIAAGSFPEITETIALNPATQTPRVAFALPASPVRIAATGQVSLNGKPLQPLASRTQLYPYRG